MCRALIFAALLILGLARAEAIAQSVEDYQALAAKAYAAPRDADYIGLRRAYFAIVSGSDTPARRQLGEALDRAGNAYNEARKQADMAAAEQHLQTMLRTSFGVISIHRLAAAFYENDMPKPDQVALHRWIGEQVMKAMAGVADGRSVATAIPVLSIREEYMIMDFLGYKVTRQALLHEGSRHYDMLAGAPKDNPAGAAIEVFFDITAFFGR